MKNTYALLIICIVFFSCNTVDKNTNKLKNPYFGQQVPGDSAVMFAKDIISLEGRYEFGISFSPDGKELLYGTESDSATAIYYSKLTEGKWTKPVIKSLSGGKFSAEMEAFFTPDGKHIYFAPFNEGMDVRIWALDRDGYEWSNLRKLDTTVNVGPVFYPICDLNNNIYFSNIKERQAYFAAYKNGKYEQSQSIGIDMMGHFFVAPDGSFALMDGRKNSIGKMDIFIVFKDKNGKWMEPINLGPIVNTEFSETCPSLSHDGKYLFFSRYNEPNNISNFYWINTDFLKNLKPDQSK